MSTQPPWQRPPGGQPPQPPAPQPPEQTPPAQQPPPQQPQTPAPAPAPPQEPQAPAPPQPTQPAPPQPTQPAPPGPAQAPPPPGPGAPAPPPPAPVAYAPPPGGPGGKGKTKLIVAIVGAVAVLVIGGSVVALAGGRDEPAPAPEPTPQPAPTPEPDPPQPDPEPQPPPDDNDLKSLIQETAGPYTLVSAEQNPEALSAGAVDAYEAVYESGGAELLHTLMAFSSPEEARGHWETVPVALQEEGFVVAAEPQPLTNEDGEEIGAVGVLVHEEKGIEVWAWTNRELSLNAIGNVGQVEAFFDGVPY